MMYTFLFTKVNETYRGIGTNFGFWSPFNPQYSNIISDTWLYTLRYFEVYTNKEYIIVS